MIYKFNIGIIMRDFLERTLHMDVKITAAPSLFESLPLIFKVQYNGYIVETNGVSWVAIEPKDVIGLPQLRKNRAQLETNAGLNCALFLHNSTFYSKEKMLEEGIPFVIKDKEVYLPFLGILLSGKNQRELKPVHRISYPNSPRLNVSKMAVSKSFDEIEYMDISVLNIEGKRRTLTMNGDKKALWDLIRPFMRDPVIRRIYLRNDIQLPDKAGISALSEYSMLSDDTYPTYAILKKDLHEKGIMDNKESVKGDTIGCVVLELGYFMDPIKESIQDPLSVLLCIADELSDPRVERASAEMMEKYVW